MISYQDITHGTTQVLVPWIESTADAQYKSYGGYHTGIDLKADEVYSCESGVVTQVGTDSSGMYELTVQYDAAVSLRYMHLKHVSVRAGAILHKGDFVGTADKYVHFEYISVNAEGSKWPVRVGKVTYFKHNPELLFSGQVLLNSNDWSAIQVVTTYYNTPYEIDSGMQSEFEDNNRGDS